MSLPGVFVVCRVTGSVPERRGGRCVLSVPGYGFLCFLFVSGMQWYGSAVVAGHVCNFNSE